MKDAKGHGSDAHSSGVQEIGQPKTYEWSSHRGSHGLMAGGNFADSVGHVYPTTDSAGKRVYRGEYSYQGTGNRPSGWSFHGSVQGAKRYVESNLAKFWNPPNVKSK